MGLNDLTLEKLISEINGYKEKMRTIHEDYGRASQDLQDRINVLGYTLNEHLKETRDQISNTPQRLLNLEIKYVTGEVNESEYRGQRGEFQGLLQRNLHSIEEIRQMIDVLSHIETKPLSPAEFKQNYPATPQLLTGGEWPKNIQPVTSQPQIATSPTLRIPIEQATPEKTETIPTSQTTPAPAPAVPQTNGTSFPNPQPNNASVSNVAIPEPATGTIPVNTVAAQTITPSTFTADSPVSAETGFDDSTMNPSNDVAEDVADALVVKVIDDMPTVEASSTTVLSPDPSQVQTVVPGAESVPELQPSPDLTKASLALPTQFYKVVCPKCGADVPKPAKVWELKGGKSKKNVLIGLFQCQDCRVKFREALTREIL